MKTLIILLTVLFLLTFGVVVVFAQDPTAEPEATAEATAEPIVPPPFPTEIPEVLPETAAKGVDVLAVMIGALAGLVGKHLTNAIKGASFFSDGDKSKIGGPAAILLAAIVSVLTGYALSYAGVAANFLDTSGVWQVLVTAWPWAVKWYHDSKQVDFPVHTATK